MSVGGLSSWSLAQWEGPGAQLLLAVLSVLVPILHRDSHPGSHGSWSPSGLAITFFHHPPAASLRKKGSQGANRWAFRYDGEGKSSVGCWECSHAASVWQLKFLERLQEQGKLSWGWKMDWEPHSAWVHALTCPCLGFLICLCHLNP